MLQRDISVNLDMIGDAQQNLGYFREAECNFRKSNKISNKLAEVDKSNLKAFLELSHSHDRIGYVLVAQGKLDAAMESFRASHAIRQRLVAADPGNAEWQRDVAVSLWRLAGIEGSGVTWRQVADAWQGLADQGVLFPPDRQFLEEALLRAEAAGSE